VLAGVVLLVGRRLLGRSAASADPAASAGRAATAGPAAEAGHVVHSAG
jgi:hypothetical protein